MFEKMLKWLRDMLNHMFDGKNTGMDVVVSDRMSSAIETWAKMYEGEELVKDKVATPCLGLAAAISAEFARLVTMEAEISVTGSARATFLQKQLPPFLDELRKYVEFGCALGGIVFKPYVSAESIIIDAVQGDCFFPTAFDTSGRLTGGIFTEQLKRKSTIFTRVERHNFSAGVHTIENKAFSSNTSYTLGKEIALAEVPEWAQITPQASISNVDRPLFAHFKVALANRVDRHSPLGVSVYAPAVRTIRDADEQYGRFLWEFEGGQLAVDLDEELFKHDPATGNAKMPKTQERLFRRHAPYSKPAGGQTFYELFSPELRDASLKNGLNTILQKIEFQCGLAYGSISDPQVIEKTAEEIRSSKQRSYSTVKDLQKSLQNAMDDLLYAMDALATLYQLAPAGAYKVAYDWDDSILSDPEQRKQMFWQYVTAGKFPFWRYLMEFEGYTEEEAKVIEAESMLSVSNPFGFDEGNPSNTPSSSSSSSSTTEVQGKSLNGAQTQSLIAIMAQYAAKQITEGQAINLISTAIGISKEEAGKLLRGEA